MTKKEESFVEKIELINMVFINTINYVNNYSEFIANSLYLNWQKIIETTKKDRYLEKLNKNIEKIKKFEVKQVNDKFIQEVIVSNLLLINKNLKNVDSRYCKRMMEEIQKFKYISLILIYLLDEYLKCYGNSSKNNIKSEQSVNNIKPNKSHDIEKDDLIELPQMKAVAMVSFDKSENCYVHIKIIDSKMILDEESFKLEKEKYHSALIKNEEEPFITDNTLRYSSFEKKRRVYVKSMYELDKNLLGLINKRVDITYPVDKIFKCAREIVDNIYKEIVNYNKDKTVLNSLFNLTTDSFGSVSKILLYADLYEYLIGVIPSLDEIVKEEVTSSSMYMIEEKGYKEFRNIESIIPTIDDLYKAANEKIIVYVCQNRMTILNNIEVLSIYTKYMSEKEISTLYKEVKYMMIQDMMSTKYFVDLQKSIVNIIKNRFKVDDEYIFKYVLEDEKLF